MRYGMELRIGTNEIHINGWNGQYTNKHKYNINDKIKFGLPQYVWVLIMVKPHALLVYQHSAHNCSTINLWFIWKYDDLNEITNWMC